MTKILGLDLGTNSIGWAVVEKNSGEDFKLLEKGVRIFQEGVKIEKGIEGSKAAERTGFRSARRIKYRRKLRKIQVLNALSEFGYCPRLTNQELNDWRYKKIYPQNDKFREWWLTYEENEKTPYFYRNLAVSEKLDMNAENDRFKVGRAFYHITQRRGFLSNRLEGTKESEGAVKKQIGEINEAKGDQTLGQYFYRKYQNGEKIRDTYTHREEHYLEEFNRICTFQDLPNEFVGKLRKAVFYQRPLKSQKGLVGKCVFETNKPRCPISRPEFEEYRMLCFINNMKIKTPFDEKLRFLNDEEKSKIIPQFYRKSKPQFDFEDIAKQLAPKNQYKFYRRKDVNLEDWLFNYSMKTNVSGCPVSARLKDLFGENFMDVQFSYIREKDDQPSVIDIDDIWHVLFSFDNEQKLKEFAKKRLRFDEGQLKEFLKLHLKKDYASLSLKAIRKILPYLRKGLIYSHAVFLANMDEAIPAEIWSDDENRSVISDEINNIITTQNEEKQIVEIVNGIIKSCRNEDSTWSEEASDLFRRDLQKKIEIHFGKRIYSSFSEHKKNRIQENAFALLKKQMQKNMGRGEFATIQRIDDRLKTFITDNFGIEESKLDKIYHPSAIEVYKPPIKKNDGSLYLGSPMVSSIRNPMAMRALHQVRKVINELIKCNIIDPTTKIHIEMARDLMNANERKAYQKWQGDRENERKEYASKIQEHFKVNSDPSDVEILKYQLWEEQNHKCLYTGNEIGLSEFLGGNPKYDIEHTIPRSLSFDNSQENKTLCENHFNRATKRNKIPFELPNYSQIIERIEPWKEKYEELDKQIQFAVRQSRGAVDKDSKDQAIQKRHRLTFERNYWRNKYHRFTMEDVPEGFKNSQLVDTGIITKYARMYLKTLFDRVYTVKGNTVADFRKLWGLQAEYVKKARTNHIHHCIDAITIACITKENYENLAKFYHDWEELYVKGVDQLPPVEKPWKRFTEDVKEIENEVLVSHYTPDVLPKQSKMKLRKRGIVQYDKKGQTIFQMGDTTRGSLHQQTFYGAIERESVDKKGEQIKKIKYVVRKPLDSLDDSSLKNIVDERVREIVENARNEEKEMKNMYEELKKKLSKADEHEEYFIGQEMDIIKRKIAKLYTLPNKNGEPVPIKKVRIYQKTVTNPLHLKKQRDKSKKHPKPYKEHYHVANDGNYLMAIYEAQDKKGKTKRDFEIVNNLEAGEFFKHSVHSILKAQGLGKTTDLIPQKKVSGKIELLLKAILKTGTIVIFWEKSPLELLNIEPTDLKKRIYKVVKIDKDGRLTFKFHQEARNDEKLNEDYKLQNGVTPPKSLTNGESFVDFINPLPKLRLSPSKFNFLVESQDFNISPIGVITFK